MVQAVIEKWFREKRNRNPHPEKRMCVCLFVCLGRKKDFVGGGGVGSARALLAWLVFYFLIGPRF